MRTPSIRTQDFLYELPAAKIAQHPPANRSASKLLVAELPRRTITNHSFVALPDLLPRESLIVMNDSRVMPARLPVFKATGGAAEIFLLEPIEPTPNPTLALEKGSPAVWNCLLGGKRLAAGDELRTSDGKVRAHVLAKERNEARVALSWEPAGESLASVLESVGKLPLPPYMKREVEREDLERYQTVYAQAAGSVAAPTAGLHFTPEVLAALDARAIRTARLTLHVGAGTFKPVEAETVAGHSMHRERFEVTAEFLETVAAQLDPKPHRSPLVAVGTTSLRTLESLYWMGALWLEGHEPTHLDQWTAYSLIDAGVHDRVSPSEAFRALAEFIVRRKLRRLVATTSLMIVPGYNFRSADILLTNFHQPGSSLIILVAAWMGERWREVYTHALSNDYRFLSYGDSSLLIR
jgi:S-adenosylmethionine:tRNA ribosyltransferase-isomerase